MHADDHVNARGRMNGTRTALLALVCLAAITCSVWALSDEKPPPSAGTSEAKASVAVIVTGDDNGYLKPCECTNGMLGGLPRRLSLLQALERKAEAQLLLSNGHVNSSHKEHPVEAILAEATLAHDRMKFETMLIAMNEMGYKAMNVSPWELKLGRQALIAIQNDVKFPLLGTNLRLKEEPKLALARGVKVPWPGGEALVVGVIGFSQQKLLGEVDANAELDEPLAAIREAQKELGPGLPLIVLAQMSAEEGRELAGQLPELVLLALPGAAGSAESNPEALSKSKPLLFTTGADGKYLAAWYLVKGAELGATFDAPAVESTYFDHPDIVAPFEIFKQRMQAESLLTHFYGKKPTEQGRTFVGSSECSNCHPMAVEKLADSRHMHAWQTLIDKGHTFDPDCVGCHVTGYTYKTGFAGEETTPSLINVTCEECHGPGSLHVQAPEKPYNIQKRECEECHNSEHSPKFRKSIYLSKIKHGKD